jgi:hypothetical protein
LVATTGQKLNFWEMVEVKSSRIFEGFLTPATIL